MGMGIVRDGMGMEWMHYCTVLLFALLALLFIVQFLKSGGREGGNCKSYEMND